MDDLIEALQILRKYGNLPNPTHCEHDTMSIAEISPSDVSQEDTITLERLGFFVNDEYGEELFTSFKFGSA